MNLYIYVNHNPLMWIDPLGFDKCQYFCNLQPEDSIFMKKEQIYANEIYTDRDDNFRLRLNKLPKYQLFTDIAIRLS